MSIFGKLASWWSERKKEQRDTERAQAEMRRADDDAEPPEGEILNDYDLGALNR